MAQCALLIAPYELAELQNSARWSFGWTVRLFVVIAREGGRSSNHKIVRDYWMPRFRGA
jgi:hypothetical protein